MNRRQTIIGFFAAAVAALTGKILPSMFKPEKRSVTLKPGEAMLVSRYCEGAPRGYDLCTTHINGSATKSRTVELQKGDYVKYKLGWSKFHGLLWRKNPPYG